MSKERDAAGKEAAAPKKSKKKLLILVMAVLLAIGGAGGYLMFSGGAKTSKTPVAKPKPKPGAVLALDAITVNLAEGHFLKVKMALQLTASAAKDTDGSEAMDLAIAEFSNRPMADFASADGRAKAKAQLLDKVEGVYPDEVMDIYFTQFVMQ